MTTKTKSLKAKYQEEIISAMKEKFGYKNINFSYRIVTDISLLLQNGTLVSDPCPKSWDRGLTPCVPLTYRFLHAPYILTDVPRCVLSVPGCKLYYGASYNDSVGDCRHLRRLLRCGYSEAYRTWYVRVFLNHIDNLADICCNLRAHACDAKR